MCIEPFWGPWGSEWANWFSCWALYLLAYLLRTSLQSWQRNTVAKNKLSLTSGLGKPPCLMVKGEPQVNVWVVGQCIRALAHVGLFCCFFLCGILSFISLIRIYLLWEPPFPFPFKLGQNNPWAQGLLVRSQKAHTLQLCPSPTETRWKPHLDSRGGKKKVISHET